MIVTHIMDDELVFYAVVLNDGSWQKMCKTHSAKNQEEYKNMFVNVSSFEFFQKSATPVQVRRSNKEHKNIKNLFRSMIVE